MIFIYNRDEVQIDTLNVKPKFIREIGKLNTLEFECEKDYEKGFRVVYEYKGKSYEFIIIDQQYERDDKVNFRYFCQDSFIENSGVPVLDKRPTGSYKVALSVALEDTRWELVTGSDYSESVQYFNSFYHISALEAFADVVNKYGLEFETSFTFTGSKITSRKIHIKKLGTQANSRLEFEKNIVKFERKILPENIVTALYGYGKGEETESGGYGRRISFADVNGGLAYVTNEEARQKYGIGPVGAKKHIFGFFIDEEETDKAKLLESTKKELERVSQPQAEYTIEAVNLHIDCDYGDMVPAIDDVISFEGNTRIIKAIVEGDDLIFVFGHVVKGFTDSFQKEIKKSAEATEIKMTSIMETRLNQIADVYFGEDGYNYDLKAGNEYGLPAGLYSFDKPIDENPTKVVYVGAGKVLISNKKGTDGAWIWQTAVTGDGISGSALTTNSVTANKLASDVGQSLDLSSNESITLKVKSTTKDYIDKNKDQLKGDKGDKGDTGATGPKGADGADGKDGVAGKDGVGIKTTTITYGLSTSESTQPSEWTSNVPPLVKGQYLWTRTVWAYTDGSSETGYTKTYISKDGNNGKNGIAGKDGVGIKTTVIEYAKHTNGTQAPSTGWQSQVPSVPDGEYLWTKTTWNYTDGTSETGYSVSKMGEQGLQGEKGDKGDTGEADYTKFRTEYETELNVLQGKIDSKVAINTYNDNNNLINEKFTQIEQTTEEVVSSVSNNAFESLKGLEEEIIEKLGSKLSQEEIQELIDGLENQIEGVSSRITQTNDSFTQEYSRIEASIENNKIELEKLTGVIQSGLDENGNTYTDWIGDDENRVRVGSDGIVMLSNNVETLKLKDGRGYMNSLYVEHELGLGNHTARKMGTEFTVFMPIGGQNELDS